jgi:hypothetical protein
MVGIDEEKFCPVNSATASNKIRGVLSAIITVFSQGDLADIFATPAIQSAEGFLVYAAVH